MLAYKGKLNHLGIDYFAKRSTMSDANNRRSEKVFADIYFAMLKKYGRILSDSYQNNNVPDKLFIADYRTVTLFNNV